MKQATRKRLKRKLRLAPAVAVGTLAVALVGLLVFVWNHAPAQNKPLEHLTTGNVGEYSALSIIAQERGYFKLCGLDVTMKDYASGPPAVADMLAGKVDLATAADYVGVINSFADPNLRIAATQLRADSFFMVARRDRSISAPSDLKGKKIGVTHNTAGEYYLGDLLILNHLRLQDVSITYGPPDTLVSLLEKGQVDAIVSFDPHIYDAETYLGSDAVTWSMQGDEKLSSLLYTSSIVVQKHPEAIQRYLQALLMAENFAQEHNQEAEQIVGSYLGYSTAYTQRIWPRLSFDVSLDEYLLITLEEQARWAANNNVTTAKTTPDYLQTIYFNGLEAVAPDAVTIIH